MQQMGIAAIYAKPQLSQASAGHTIYPYVLRGVKIARVNHVWSTDITYLTFPLCCFDHIACWLPRNTP
jgi:putative transposase